MDASLTHSYDHACSLDLDHCAALTFDLHRSGGLVPKEGFYPAGNRHGTCVATSHNGFVVGPRGELYKCWEDVGDEQMVIGDVHEKEPITDPELRALYALGTDAYDDPECLACNALPICGGGCANRRLRAQHFGEEGLMVCSPYRDHLTDYLEEYYDVYLSRALLAVGLPVYDAAEADRGYRLVQPQKRRPEDEPHPLAEPLGQER